MSKNLQYAQVLFEQKKYKKAVPFLKKAIHENPKDAGAHELLAMCYINLGSNKEGLEAVEKALVLEPNFSRLYYVRAIAYGNLGLGTKAMQQIEEAIRLFPYEAAYFAYAARASFHGKDYEKALEFVKQANEIDPLDLETMIIHTQTLFRLGKKDEMHVMLDDLMKHHAGASAAYICKGGILLEMGKVKESEEVFLQARKLSPENRAAQKGMDMALKSQSSLYRWFHQKKLETEKHKGIGATSGALLFWITLKTIQGLMHAKSPLVPFVIAIAIILSIPLLYLFVIDPIFSLLIRNKWTRLLFTKKIFNTKISEWLFLIFFVPVALFGIITLIIWLGIGA